MASINELLTEIRALLDRRLVGDADPLLVEGLVRPESREKALREAAYWLSASPDKAHQDAYVAIKKLAVAAGVDLSPDEAHARRVLTGKGE